MYHPGVIDHPLHNLTPSNYWHARGLVEALDASVEWLRVCAGASFATYNEAEAKALREVAEQFDREARRLRKTIISFPEPDDPSMLDVLNQPVPPRPQPARLKRGQR